MGTIAAPNISEFALQLGQQQQNAGTEYARAAQLKPHTAASRQQMQQSAAMAPGQLEQQDQQIQAQQMQNQQAQLELQDQQNAHKLGPQFLQKDDSGKITGFDNEGYYNALIGSGMNPAKVNGMRQQQLTYQQGLQKLSKDQLDLQNEKNDNAYQIIEPLRQAANDPKADVAHVNSTWQAVAPKLLALGIRPQDIPASFQTPQEAAGKIQDFENELGQHKQMLTDAETQSKTNQQNAKAQLDQAEAAQKGSPLTMMETNPAEMAGDKLPAAMGYLQSKLNDPGTSSTDKARATRLLSTAKITQQNQLALEASKKATDQAIADGDPNAAAKLLTQGTVSPSQIISSRKPEFAQKAFSAAAALDPNWNAQKAEADFNVAKSPGNVAFFGSAKSLTDKGGTLDQLADAAKDIPGGQIPVFNKIADVIQASTGSGPVAKYASILLGVADDYSKVMGGGQGSDTSREQALHLAPTSASPEARAAAIEGIRGAVGSQLQSRIGNNKVMQQMYGSQFSNTGAANRGGGSGGTPQGMIRARDPQGHLHEAPAGTALPKGWTLQ